MMADSNLDAESLCLVVDRDIHMSQNPYQTPPVTYGDIASMASVDARTSFIRKTYLHLLGAIRRTTQTNRPNGHGRVFVVDRFRRFHGC